jgi:HlyD family secretion protein
MRIVFSQRYILGALGALIVGVTLYVLIAPGQNRQSVTHEVERGDVTQAILLSGVVDATSNVDLSFGISGTLERVFFLEGQTVEEGDVLAALDTDALEADLLQANANVEAARANILTAEASVAKAEANLALVRAQNRGDTTTLAAAEERLVNTTAEREVLVSNALQELLDNDLQVYPDVVLGSLPSFELSGSYLGDEQGEYRFRVYTSSQSNIGYSLNVEGLEDAVVHFVAYDQPQALGEHGLFITFPSEGEGLNYNNSRWVIPVPNVRSSTYQSKLSAYNSARSAATIAIANARNEVERLQALEASDGISLDSAEELQAEAALAEARGVLAQRRSALAQTEAARARVRAQLNDGVIAAPFSGTVARVELQQGQRVTAGTPVMTLITQGEYVLSMSVPELDVSRISVGDSALITLNIYGDDVVWDGIVESIELVETEVDGVPVYRSDILLLEPDERIRIGMNARARIVLDTREDVIAIPASFIERSGEQSFVFVHQGPESVERRSVEIGLRGSNNFIEITNGLNEGEVLISPNDAR